MDGSLVDRNVGSGSLSLHRILQDSVAHSFDTSTRSRSFNRVLFFLNGCFPVQQDGGQLFEWWCQCEEFVPHIVSAVRFYKKYRQHLGPPIILAEIIRRCAWYFAYKHENLLIANQSLGTYGRNINLKKAKGLSEMPCQSAKKRKSPAYRWDSLMKGTSLVCSLICTTSWARWSMSLTLRDTD